MCREGMDSFFKFQRGQGRIQGRGVLGVRIPPPPPLWVHPNFIKREKTLRVYARKRRILVLNSYPDPSLSEILYPTPKGGWGRGYGWGGGGGRGGRGGGGQELPYAPSPPFFLLGVGVPPPPP